MAMTGAMSAAISGLKTHMQALSVVGNNIANVNTNGYKAQMMTFKESIYNTLSAGSEGTQTMGGTNPQQLGYGCQVGTIDLDMSTGDLVSTGRDLDCAIKGDGFFLVGDKTLDINSADAVKKLTLTRVGDFEFIDGYLTDGQGNVVYGFLTSAIDEKTEVEDGITVTNNTLAGSPGTTVGNISTDLVPIRLPMRATGVDANGAAISGVQAGDAVYVGVDGNGKNIDPTDTNTANNPTYSAARTLDGFIDYENLRIDANGKITCNNKDTGDPVVVGYIALGSVENLGAVLHTDGPYYQAGDAAGSITVSTANSAVTGNLRNGQILDATTNATDPATALSGKSGVGLMTAFLEGSGTDLATEFSNMIIYQRGYQANTRIITVTDSMLEELVNMKR